MLAAEPSHNNPDYSQRGLFHGLLSDVARHTLLRSGCTAFAPSPEQDVDGFVRHFSGLWARVGDGSTPEPAQVRKLMGEQESLRYEVWRLALRNDMHKESMPLVAQAPVIITANPLILRTRRLNAPLIVMSEGLWNLVLGCVLGLLHWAEQGDMEKQGKTLLVESATSWLANNPDGQPTGMQIADAATVSLDITNFAVGLAEAAFTWAFLHEMGHFILGHLPANETVRQMADDGATTASSLSYGRQDEIEADLFGFDRFLNLMPLSMQIRRHTPFGPQIDHAPIIAFELMDLAYRLGNRQDLLLSATHPAPLERAERLMEARESSLSDEGRELVCLLARTDRCATQGVIMGAARGEPVLT